MIVNGIDESYRLRHRHLRNTRSASAGAFEVWEFSFFGRQEIALNAGDRHFHLLGDRLLGRISSEVQRRGCSWDIVQRVCPLATLWLRILETFVRNETLSLLLTNDLLGIPYEMSPENIAGMYVQKSGQNANFSESSGSVLREKSALGVHTGIEQMLRMRAKIPSQELEMGTSFI